MQGGCYCGAVRYEVTGQPVMKGQCHCRECQYISGGGPNYFMTVPSDGFVITKGAIAEFERDDIPNPRLRQFCPKCGTHLTTVIREMGFTVVKVGTLDHPAEDYRAPAVAIYLKDAQPFHLVPEGKPTFDALPPRR
ncbi:MAG: GFA family protein [Pseudomonadota bacterium]